MNISVDFSSVYHPQSNGQVERTNQTLENPDAGRASIYKSVIINTSKEMMCYSDFPIPDDYPNYMHNSKILRYFKLYAEHFHLIQYIRFKTSVCSVKKRPDFAKSGQWEVITEKDGKQESAVFDAVLVCSGHHTEAHIPLQTFPAENETEMCYSQQELKSSKDNTFTAEIIKNPEQFKGKRVIVIGIGNSGGDIAVELSRTASQVFLSTRRGSWIINRVSDYGYPVDMLHHTRFFNALQHSAPNFLVNHFAESKLNQRFDHANYGLKPKHR
ncbi:unnamed protein product [Ranitomeya imitator]|uniref:Flavin-containing monooxygenase n=1 Tax=Ranitomeya imitator TaxID=111125 RepID=A0ABN9KSC7_9NEOB|nr:unnamed protein product [Ranitomeya imitator]